MNFIFPNWPAPNNIKSAITTKKIDGVSHKQYSKFNLGKGSGEDISIVDKNRQLLKEKLNLTEIPIFLNQTHSVTVIELPSNDTDGDAAYTQQANQVCLIQTADCLPVLITDKKGTEVAAAHAGWRGLCNGILENTLTKFKANPTELLIWLGPCIGPKYFEVGEEVRQAFIDKDEKAESAFITNSTAPNKYLANLFELASQRLTNCGVKKEHIFSDFQCTYTNSELFYSYRRDKGNTGRFVSLIWIEIQN